MDNVTFIDMPQIDGSNASFAIINHGNNEFTSMPKSVYDAQQAAQVAPTTGLAHSTES